MTFKPPYWYHDNIEFSYEDLKELKEEGIDAQMVPWFEGENS